MLTFRAVNTVLWERVIRSAILALFGMIVLFGPGNPARAWAVNAPDTFSSWDGEMLTINGTSVVVRPPLNSSVCAIAAVGSPAALPFSGHISPVRAVPPLIEPAEPLVGGVVTGGP
jgi:hypothetical protein